MPPVLRAITESGDRYDDPSEDHLFMLFEDIEAGEGTFLIVEDTADSNGQTYIQAQVQTDGSYVVERREGIADCHFGTSVADMRGAHDMIVDWAFGSRDCSGDARWSRLRF